MKKIILASGSPRRKELLEQIGLNFEIDKSDYVEDMSLPMKPEELAKFLSGKKAGAVAHKYSEGIIIAADTFIVLENEILGKPHTEEKAREMLRKISGQVVCSVTGFTVFDAGSKKEISQAVSTKIFIKELDRKEIDNYVATGETLDKAGAFGIQNRGTLIIEKIEGSYSNIVGLPLFEMGAVLKEFGISII